MAGPNLAQSFIQNVFNVGALLRKAQADFYGARKVARYERILKKQAGRGR